MCTRVVGNVSNSDYGKITNRIFNAIEKKGALKRSELTQSVKGEGVDRQVRSRAVSDLLEAEDIVTITVKIGRRITDWYGVSYQSVADRLIV